MTHNIVSNANMVEPGQSEAAALNLTNEAQRSDSDLPRPGHTAQRIPTKRDEGPNLSFVKRDAISRRWSDAVNHASLTVVLKVPPQYRHVTVTDPLHTNHSTTITVKTLLLGFSFLGDGCRYGSPEWTPSIDVVAFHTGGR